MNKNEFGIPPKEYERLYNVWRNMVRRCHDPQSDRYYTYGARGIFVCDEWKGNFHAFVKFAIENGWRQGLSIERIDLDKGYSPSNCTFITMSEQARNKTTNVLIKYKGKTKCVMEWCEELGLNPKTIYKRIYDGHKNPEIILHKGNLRQKRRYSDNVV